MSASSGKKVNLPTHSALKVLQLLPAVLHRQPRLNPGKVQRSQIIPQFRMRHPEQGLRHPLPAHRFRPGPKTWPDNSVLPLNQPEVPALTEE